ncbi:MAG: cysteine desulfurase NifS [Dehalococcoidales bacterium]|nr:cysteine desulfurase NifS [Dehalococcoidales bacterium]
MKRIYLDYAATTPVHPDVLEKMLPYFAEEFGNPSAIHSYGQTTRGAIDEARDSVAGLIGCAPEEIVFTSGGTEADNQALSGVVAANGDKGNHIITTAIEHHAVLETCDILEKQGCSVTVLPVGTDGLVDPASVRNAVTPETVLISVMHANNEIGTVQPLAEIGKIAREAGILFHTDAVQSVGRIPVDVDELGVDLLSMSAHKLYGPKGAGALYIRQGTSIVPMVHGGAQEHGWRAGTENVPGIVGLGAAAELARREMAADLERQTVLRDRLIQGILQGIGHTYLNGHPEKRLPNNVNIGIAYVEGEAILLTLDLLGICASSGSACSSGSLEASHVMLAVGCPPELARGSLRFTLGKWTTDEDIDRVLEVLPGIVSKLRAMSPIYKPEQEKKS